jgi:hypothetical protein
MLISLMRLAKRCKVEGAAMLATSRATISACLEVAPMNRELPSPEFLRKILAYNPDTGELQWLERTPDMFIDAGKTASHQCKIWNALYAGKLAFATTNSVGYKVGGIFGKKYTAHRVIWALHHGEWPKNEIDHKNGIRTDNRISNLRSVIRAENNRNMSISKRNTSGHVGVSFDARRGKYYASISGKFLGYFDDMQSAIDTRRKAQVELGFHPNHGRQA